jgi:hypothetical protein
MAGTDFIRLDQAEDPRAYRRERARVYSLRGRPYDCHVYFAIPDHPDLPDHDYLDGLIQAGRNAGLPPEYLAQLDARRPPQPPIPHPVPSQQPASQASPSAVTPPQ